MSEAEHIYGRCSCGANLTARHIYECPDRPAHGWRTIESAPKDGSHILVCLADPPYTETWTFNQCPPAVVHYWNVPGEEGFYLSCGDQGYPYKATHWKSLGVTPSQAQEGVR